MFIDDFIWLPTIVDKIEVKHSLVPEEVEQVFFNSPKFRLVERGLRAGEDVFAATGQTDEASILSYFSFVKRTMLR